MKITTSFEIQDTDFENAVEKAIKNNPDFVIVTRCKDCRFDDECCRIIRKGGRNSDDYCSFAERKTETDEY